VPVEGLDGESVRILRYAESLLGEKGVLNEVMSRAVRREGGAEDKLGMQIDA